MAGPLADDGDDLTAQTEINITPFIDVMLVLLIIFMVAAPLSTVDVPVELPVAVAAPAPRPDEPVFVTLSEDLSVRVGDEVVALPQLLWKVELATKLKRDTRIYISADKSVPYGELMAVMNQLRRGAYVKVALVGLEEGAEPAPEPAE